MSTVLINTQELFVMLIGNNLKLLILTEHGFTTSTEETLDVGGDLCNSGTNVLSEEVWRTEGIEHH